jgi:hypothetical protein
MPDSGVPTDASIEDASIDDAPPPVDAGTRIVTVRPDPRRTSPRDAGVAIDAAAPASTSTGSAPVTIKYKPGTYTNISIDGAPGEPGPIYRRKLDAGRHTIKFLDAKTGEILDEQTITVEDGKPLEVRQRD